jgi:hypothetical protein
MSNHKLEKTINEIVHPHSYYCPAREKGLCYQRGTECPHTMKVEPNCEDRSLIFIHLAYQNRIRHPSTQSIGGETFSVEPR